MRIIHKSVALAMIFMLLPACKSTSRIESMPKGNYSSTIRNVPYSAGEPLRDLNIAGPRTHTRLAALQNPYGTDTHHSCAAILREAQMIDQALQQNHPRKPGTIHSYDTKAGYVGNAADVTTKAVTTSLIPFRGVVRYFSGATKRDMEIMQADQRGRERLGFLIGVGSANGCPGFTVPQSRLR